jgi:hypothetical protein
MLSFAEIVMKIKHKRVSITILIIITNRKYMLIFNRSFLNHQQIPQRIEKITLIDTSISQRQRGTLG